MCDREFIKGYKVKDKDKVQDKDKDKTQDNIKILD